MKFATVSGQSLEAQPGLAGQCPCCDSKVIAKCGETRFWHWAHQGVRSCDPWWESETEWHRSWKDLFPAAWQEVIHRSESGEKHVADLKTDRGWVIELQHSYIDPAERRARDDFYKKLIWVVDGTRRKRDSAQLFRSWREGIPVAGDSLIRKVIANDCALLKDWAGTDASAFFDLGEIERLWWLFAKGTGGLVYLAPYSRMDFVESHRTAGAAKAKEFDDFVRDVPTMVREHDAQLRIQKVQRAISNPLFSHPAGGAGRRRRF